MSSIRCETTIQFGEIIVVDNTIRPTDESITNACEEAIREFNRRVIVDDDELPPPPALMRSERLSYIESSRDILDAEGAPLYVYMTIFYTHFDNDKGDRMITEHGNLMFKNNDEYWIMEFTPEGITAVLKLSPEDF